MNKEQVLFYVRKYKQNFVPIALYFFGFFILLKILIPQITQFQSVRKEYQDKNDQIELLKSSIETLSSLDEASLNDTLSDLERALPREQDATLIVSSINAAALRANAEVVGYTINPGRIYEKPAEDAGLNQTEKTANEAVPFQELELQVTSDGLQNIIDLAQEFQELVPISEITKLSTTGGEGNFLIKFYYKPFNKEAVSKRDVVTPFRTSDLELIAKIKGFNS